MSNRIQNWDSRSIFWVGSALFLLIVGGVLLWPLAQQKAVLQLELDALREQESEYRALSQKVHNLNHKVTPLNSSLVTWISKNVLNGFEEQLLEQQVQENGLLATLKYRQVSPQQITLILNTINKSSLWVHHIASKDWDGDGRWELELTLGVQQP